MMGWYILKLIILLPLIGVMIWGVLRMAHRLQGRMGVPQGGARRVRVVETLMLSPTQKLAVLEFHDREILVASTRTGLTRLAEVPTGKGSQTISYSREGGAA